jgi:hypothetical protein
MITVRRDYDACHAICVRRVGMNRSSTNLGGGVTGLDCGGAFYSPVAGGYQVIPPPVGATTWTLPSGAVDQNINGASYFAYGGAYYRPIYSGSSVYYEVVANPA